MDVGGDDPGTGWRRLGVAVAAAAVVMVAVAAVTGRVGGSDERGEPTEPGGASPEVGEDPHVIDEEAAADGDDLRLLLVVGDESLRPAEEDLLTGLEEALGFTVEIMDDADVTDDAASRHAVVVISKSVRSEEIADKLLETQAGVVFWEDNAQVVEQGGDEVGVEGGGSRGLATIDVINPESTAWHHPATEVYVNPDAPAELRAGLSGSVSFYREPADMTFAPTVDGASTVAPSAMWIAEYDHQGNGRYVYYVIEADAGLADGTETHGRRVYFGLYDETFPLLTEDGRALFDAAVTWAAGHS